MMMNEINNDSKNCDFCGRLTLMGSLFTSFSSGLTICGSCVSSCFGSLMEKKQSKSTSDQKTYFDALEIKNILDQYVVGQNSAKRDLSLAVAYHIWRKSTNITKKMNILLMGPTGTGKTYMVETLLEKLRIPYVISDATVMSATGYVGADPDDTIRDLTAKIEHGFSVDEIKRGVIVIDEIDKIRKNSSSSYSDITNVAVQQELLKLMEGRVVDLRKKFIMSGFSSNFPSSTFDTKDILFIFMGAFTDIYKSREDRQKYLPSFAKLQIEQEGNSAEERKTSMFLEEELGLITEFTGRLSIISQLNTLTKSELKEILIGTSRPIVDEFKTYFYEKSGIELRFADNGIDYIIEQSSKKQYGARGLRSYILNILLEDMFNVTKLKENKVKTINIVENAGKIITKHSYND